MPNVSRWFLLVVGVPMLAQEAAPSLAELQSRFPKARTMYTRWTVRHEEEAAGFWKGANHRTITTQREALLLKDDGATARKFQPGPLMGTKLASAWVAWTFPGGKTEKHELGDFKVQTIGVEKRYEYTLPSLPAGTRIEEGSIQEGDGVLHGLQTLEIVSDIPIRDFRLELVVNRGSTHKLKNPFLEFGLGSVQKVPHEDGKRERVIYTLQDFQPMEYQPFSRFFPASSYAVKWNVLHYPMYFLSVDQMVGRLGREAGGRKSWRSGAYDELLAQILKENPGPEARAKAVMDYLRANLKVISRGEDQDASSLFSSRLTFSEMIERKEGTLSAIPALMAQLLNDAGVPAKLALIHASRSGQFDPDYLDSREPFELAVLMELEKGPTYAFPQERTTPFGHLTLAELDRPVVVVSPKGASEILRTPASLASENHFEETWSLAIDDRGRGRLHFERDAKGPQSLDLVEKWQKLYDWQKTTARKLGEMTPAAPPGKAETGRYEPSKTEPDRLKIVLDLDLGGVCRVKDGAIELVPAAVPFMVGLIERAPLQAMTRTEPIWLPYEQVTHRVLTIQIPKGMEWKDTLPAASEFSNALGSAKASFGLAGSSLQVDQTLVLHGGLHPASRWVEMLALAGPVSPLAMPVFQFKPTPASKP